MMNGEERRGKEKKKKGEEKKRKERMSGEGKTVCVTGGAGYIASWLVKLLLQRGYTVKATVRDPNNPKKTEHLLALEGAKERLKLFKANLLEDGSFDSVVDGCEGVFHTASPVTSIATDPQAELIDPALNGTLNVLRSCAKFPSVKRVVITSSTAAVLYSGDHRNPDAVVDETWYSDPVYCKESKLWYQLGKTLAENAAWKFAKENGIDMVTIHPAFVIGPMLQPSINETMEMILNLVNGATTYPNGYYRSVDVRDVAEAHILALEIPSAAGRYILVENIAPYSEVLKIVKELYPNLNLPSKCDDNKILLPYHEISKEKAKAFGLHFTPLKTTLKDSVESLKEKGFLHF